MSLGEWLVDRLRPFEFRGKPRLLGRFVPATGTRAARVHGARMELDLADEIQRAIYLGHVGPEEVAAVRRSLPVGGTMIDVGANVGFFTALACACLGPTGRVLAFEPSGHVFQRLARMIAGNQLTQVQAFQMALSDSEGTLRLSIPPARIGNHSPTFADVAGWEKLEVPIGRLDDYVSRLQTGTVDLLKIDVEGHEPRVLAGAEVSLRSGRVRHVLCEFNDHWLRQCGATPTELWQQLTEMGFVDPHSRARCPEFAPGCVESRWFVRRG